MFKKIVLLVGVLLSGCATIFDGTKDTVSFNSTPSQAKIYVNGMEMGTTPTNIRMRKSENQMIEIKKEGYETKNLMPTTGFNPLALLNTIAWPFWIVDAATGAIWEVDPSFYNVTLEPKKAS